MTFQQEKLLRFWAAGPDNDQYRHVKHEFGFNQAKARRAVRSTLHRLGWYPHTSAEFQDIRAQIRKGATGLHELI
jgi:hypothetical protein